MERALLFDRPAAQLGRQIAMTSSEAAINMSKRAGLPFVGVVCLVACTGDPRAGSNDRPASAPVASAVIGTSSRAGSARAAVLRLAAVDTTVTWDIESRLIGDVDCDGVADSAFIGRAKAAVHVGLIRAKVASPEILSFAIGSGIQEAVCSDKAALAFESLDYDPKDAVGEIDGFQRSTVCRGLNLGDGDCDSIHMFWNTSSHHLDWWRA